MSFAKQIYILITLLTMLPICGKAQNAPIGYWDSHLPYNTAIGVATDGATIYTICSQAFFTYNIKDGAMVTYSKVEGMSDIGMQCIGYDALTQTTVLVYSDGNIDLFKNNTFYNIPDLKLKTVFENKKVSQVYTEQGIAYLSTSLGLVVIDLTNYNIDNTYQIIHNNESLPINSFTGSGNYFYAVTRSGLYRADKQNPHLENSNVWQCIDSIDTFSSIVTVNNVLFLSTKKKVFTFTADTLQAIYTPGTNIQHIDGGYTNLFIGVSNNPGGSLKIMNTGFNIIDSFDCTDSTVQAVQLSDSSIWVAAPQGGLKKRTGENETKYYIPDGPSNPYSFDLYAYNKNLYIAHGGYSSNYFANWSYNGISNLNNGKWTFYKRGLYPPLNSTPDIVALAKDESTGILYAGSYLNGLFILHNDGWYSIVNQNSIFDGSIAYGSGFHQIMGLALDRDDNLWVGAMFSKHQLYVKTRDSNWYKFSVPHVGYGGSITTDDSGQVWIACSFSGGLVVYNPYKISDTGDDASYFITSGIGYGNLPGSGVICIAKDKKNEMWVGTDNGIAIFKNCIAKTNSSQVCDAEIPEVNYGQYSGPLFAGDFVATIAVDAVDRKWVGTHHGVWLLSPDAQQVIYHFTKDNSPLPSDYIQKIFIDKATGDVYIGTDQGLISYHGTATEGSTSNQNVEIFPNPVPGGYTGAIAIKGLVTNADVRITDIDGQLVYRTQALGGEAIWNGKDYTGRRPQSGVYLIFVSGSDGKYTYTGKIVFIQ